MDLLDQPFQLLDDCHGGIRTRCQLIERIAGQLKARAPDMALREAAHAAMRFFDTTVEAHHRDEEEDLFPALLASVPEAERDATRALIARLRADHVRLDTQWRALRRHLVLLVAVGNRGLTPVQAAEFRRAYERHVAVEENEVLPLARRVLGPESVATLGTHMAKRRRTRWTPSPL